VHKISVLHVILTLKMGGAEKNVQGLVRSLNKEKFNNLVACLDEKGLLGEALELDGYGVVCMQRKPGLDGRLPIRLAQHCKKNGIQVIHAYQYTAFFYSFLSKLFHPKIKVIFNERGRFYPDLVSTKRRLFNRIINPWVDKITAVSDDTRTSLVEKEGFAQNKIEVIYNGIDTQNFYSTQESSRQTILTEFHISPERILLLFVGRINSVKNLPLLLRSFAELRKVKPTATLLVVGEGEELENCKKLGAELGLSDKDLIFTGLRTQVRDFLACAHIFVLSSYTEGLSGALLEAMAYALPVVCTRVGGNPEIVKEGETGFLVPSDDVSAFSQALIKLANDKDLRLQMGLAGQSRVKENFSYQKMVQRYETLYTQLAGLKKK